MRMTPNDLDNLIEKYLEGKCTPEEIEFIDSLYRRLGNSARDFSALPSPEKVSATGAHILREIQQHAAAGKVGHSQKRRVLLMSYGMAACVVLILSLAFYFLPRRGSNQVAAVERHTRPPFISMKNTSSVSKRVILPDGSIVEVSPSSQIRFSNDADSPSRELFLEGEAYFDVAHNKQRPFYVYAGNVVTKVLGTTFTVRTTGRDRKVTVSVKTGKVTVYSRNAAHKKTVLVPNQEAIYDRTTDVVATQPVAEEQLREEKKNFAEMHFAETPVPEVLAALTKTYHIDIVFPKERLSGCVLTSSFMEEGLYDRIDVICTAIGATYKIVDARIIIESNGCNLKPS